MNLKRLVSVLMLVPLLLTTALPSVASAKDERTIQDESIYDLLVDRFNNGSGNNDGVSDAQDLSAFNGGDFVGISLRLEYLIEMGFTSISIGSVFETANYSGTEVIDYTQFEPRFGTEEDFTSMLDDVHEADIRVITDFPLAGVSKDNEWAEKLPWTEGEGDTIDWKADDANVQRVLEETMVDFVKKYEVDGIRLTRTEDYDTEVLNGFIAALKKASPDLYIIGEGETDANVDTQPNEEAMQALRESFVEIAPDTSSMDLFESVDPLDIIQFDELNGPRFTYDIVKKRMFPPTRWKVAVTSMFTLPGIPMMTYGTEIAVNGKEAPESHPLLNFKTDMELQELIGDMNKLRNESKTLRTGDFKMLHNKDGFLVYKVYDEDETWIIAINNTSETQNYALTPDEIGTDKRLRALLGTDQVVLTEDDHYNVVVDRELAEIYLVKEDKGFNIPYLIASILIYVFFFGFLWAVWRKGRQSRKARAKK